MNQVEEKEEADCEGSSNQISNPCPICLGIFTQPSYLDKCFHKFCYKCILRWTEVVSRKLSSAQQVSSVKCPLCKTENYSIIYEYDGHTFQRHFINGDSGDRTFFSKAHKYRLQCYYTEPGPLQDTFKVLHYWKLCRYLQPNRQLEIWLRRELQALIQEEDVEIIMHHIIGVIESFSKGHQLKATTHAPELKQKAFKTIVADAARPFLAARTERFADEVELFLASGLTIVAYDNAYQRCLGWQKADEIPENPGQSVTEHDPVAPSLYLSPDEFDEAEWSDDEHA